MGCRVVAILILAATASVALSQPPAKKIVKPEEVWARSLAADFAFDFYRATLAERESSSFCCSPYSAMNALAMVVHGSTNAGREEFDRLWPTSHDFAAKLETSHLQSERLLEGLRSMNDGLLYSEENKESIELELKQLKQNLAKLDQENRDVLGRIRPRSTTEKGKVWAIQTRMAELEGRLAKSELSIANAIWIDNSMPLRRSFVDVARLKFGAAIEPADFLHATSKEINRINTWCSEKTRGKISSIVDELSVHDETRFVLVNAIYFNAAWESPFEKALSKKEPFTMLNGHKKSFDMMRGGKAARYAEFRPDGSLNEMKVLPVSQRKPFGDKWELPANPGGWKVLELPYKGGRFSFVAVLPNEKDGLRALESRLLRKNFDEWRSNMEADHVAIVLPRFKLESKFDLEPLLKKLGVEAIFKPGSLTGFSGSTDSAKLHVDAAIQVTSIDVKEEGTEAAAITATIGGAGGGEPGPSKPLPEFIADHPFIYMIRDSKSGAILFIGRFTGEE